MRPNRQITYFLFVLLMVLLVGCNPSEPTTETTESTTTTQPISIKLAIVEQPSLGEEIQRLWQAHNGGEVNLTNLSMDQLLSQDGTVALDQFDALIYPARLKGHLASADQLFELEEFSLSDPDLKFSEYLRYEQEGLLNWDQDKVALSLGQPQLAVFANKQLLEKLDIGIPKTWTEFNETLKDLDARRADIELNDITLLVQPGDNGDLAANLFARAGGYLVTPGRYSTYFDIQTMDPLIDSPPFVRALEEMIESAKYSAFKSVEQCYQSAINNQSLFTVMWPAKTWSTDSDTEFSEAIPMEVASLPTSDFRYDYSRGDWVAREDSAVVLPIGFNGLLVSVGKKTTNPVIAQEFVVWLCQRRTLGQLAGFSPDVSVARSSQLLTINDWTGNDLDSDSLSSYADIIEAYSESRLSINWLQTRNSQAYIDHLESSIHDALAGKVDAQTALSSVSSRWKTLTEELGVDEQRKYYQAGSGL